MMDAKKQTNRKSVFDIHLPATDGTTYHLADLKGKKLYLKAWASWCPVCLAELKSSCELAASPPKGSLVLSVVFPKEKGEQSERAFQQWYQSLDDHTLPVLLDTDGHLLKQYRIHTYPTSFFIDSKGDLAFVRLGHLEKEEIRQMIEKME